MMVTGIPANAKALIRTGAVEVWGRGTNRVIEECRLYGLETPEFREESGGVVVTIRAEIAPAAQVTAQVTTQVTMQVTTQVAAVLQAASQVPKSREELQHAAGIRNREHFRKAYLEPLLNSGWMERTIPDKPRSRLQRYRTTQAGLAKLAAAEGKGL